MFASVAVLVVCLLAKGNPEPFLQSQGIPAKGSDQTVAPSQTSPQQNGGIESSIVFTDVPLDSANGQSHVPKLYEPVFFEEYPGSNYQSTSQTAIESDNQNLNRPLFSQSLYGQRNETGQSVGHEQPEDIEDNTSSYYESFGQRINVRPLKRSNHTLTPQDRRKQSGVHNGSQAVGEKPVSSFSTQHNPSSHVGVHSYSRPEPAVALGLENRDGTTETSGKQGSTVSIDKDVNPANTERKENDHLPWQVSVFSNEFELFRRICGGSMVSRSAVISAAHYYWEEGGNKPGLLPAAQFAVGAGEMLPYRRNEYDSYRQQNGQAEQWHEPRLKSPKHNPVNVYAKMVPYSIDARHYVYHATRLTIMLTVAAIKVPPSFTGYTSGYCADIAVLLLARPFFNERGMRPVCISFDRGLEARQMKAGNVATTLGVNYIQEEKRNHLQLLKVPYMPVEDCKAALGGDTHFMTEDKICARFKPVSPSLRDMCSQDGGAGLAFYLGDDYDQAKGIAIPFLRGVASLSRPCDAHTPKFYTRMSAHREFLEEHLKGVEEECGRYYPQLGAFLDKQSREVEFVCNCFC